MELKVRDPSVRMIARGSTAKLILSLAMSSTLLWLIAIVTAKPNTMNGYGLASVLGPLYWLALALLAVAVTLSWTTDHQWLVPVRTLLVFITALFLFGTATAVESGARIPDSYITSGFIQYIVVHGHVPANFDARFFWPAFFALFAAIVKVTGQANPLFLIRWAPLILNLLCLPSVFAISRPFTSRNRTRFLALILFLAGNWVEQDYLSPQAVNEVLLLGVLAVFINLWKPHAAGLRPAIRRVLGWVGWKVNEGEYGPLARLWRALSDFGWFGLRRAIRSMQEPESSALEVESPAMDTFMPPSRGILIWSEPSSLLATGSKRIESFNWFGLMEFALKIANRLERYEWFGRNLSDRSLDRATKLGALGILLGTIISISISHQLTPYGFILLALGMWLGSRRPGILVATFTIIVASGWLSVAAIGFWQNHFSLVFGLSQGVSSSVNQTLTSRVTGNLDHVVIVALRIVITGLFTGLAIIGGILRKSKDRAPEYAILFIVPLPFLQPYGGEGLLRSFLYVLPFLAILGAIGIDRIAILIGARSTNSAWRRNLGRSFVAFVVLLTTALLSVARGGNDPYESFTNGDLTAVTAMYEKAPGNEVVGAYTFYLPWNDFGVDRLHFFTAGAESPRSPKSATSILLAHNPGLIVLTASQDKWGELLNNWPKNWMYAQIGVLTASGYHIVGHWSDAYLLQHN